MAAGSASPGSSAAAASSEPGTPVPLVLSGAKASSSVGNRPKFAASMAIDGDLATSWQEGSQQEKDQWIEVSFDPSLADTLAHPQRLPGVAGGDTAATGG